MKKQIEITKKTTEFIEVEIPSFFKRFNVNVSITAHSIIQVWPDSALISFTPASDERFNAKIAELMNDKPHHKSITIEEFETAFNNTIKCLTEQYQLSMNMLHDPKEQTAEGQEVKAAEATEQTEQATEETGEAVAVE
jgi:hypothetical protein